MPIDVKYRVFDSNGVRPWSRPLFTAIQITKRPLRTELSTFPNTIPSLITPTLRGRPQNDVLSDENALDGNMTGVDSAVLLRHLGVETAVWRHCWWSGTESCVSPPRKAVGSRHIQDTNMEY